jgi:hypothetical protein
MPNFETFHRSKLRLSDEPTVTVHHRGTLSLNASAFTCLGQPVAVDLLFDRELRIIGLQPADPSSRHCVFIRRAGPTARGPFLVSARSYAKFYDIDIPQTMRWPAELIGGVLCVNIDDPGVPVTSNRAKPVPSPPVLAIVSPHHDADESIQREAIN